MSPHKMRLWEAKQIAGTLSFPSKLPGTSYGLPAKNCVTGSKLAEIEGTVCHGCYALKGQYKMRNCEVAMERRLRSLTNPRWIEAIVTMLTHYHSKPYIMVDLGHAGVRAQRKGGERSRPNPTGFHRWFDSGDLQSFEHLEKIVEVCRRTPKIHHWMPTQELGIVKRYLATGGTIPDNLVIRVSSVMLDDQRRRAWPHTSSVFMGEPPAGGRICPAKDQGHECRSCRSCWDKDVAHVNYAAH